MDFSWTDKVDGKDVICACDINAIAGKVIENAKQISNLGDDIGNIETALDGILALQNTLIGGEGA